MGHRLQTECPESVILAVPLSAQKCIRWAAPRSPLVTTWTHFPGGGTVSPAIHLAAAGLHGFVVVFVPRAGRDSSSAGGNE